MNIEFYFKWYNQIDYDKLKGIFIEELVFLYFKNWYNSFKGEDSLKHIFKYNYYTEGENSSLKYVENDPLLKINNNKYLSVRNNEILVIIQKVKKYYVYNEQIFAGDRLINLPNGIYFLYQKCPIIDAVIVNQAKKNLILVQIKKTITNQSILKYLDDFHILYFLLEEEEIYKDLLEIQLKSKKINHGIKTKLQFFMKITNFIKRGWSINFMFAYNSMENKFNFYGNNEIEDRYKDTSIEAIKFMIEDDIYNKNQELLGKYKIENKNVTIFRNRVLHNIIMSDLNDFTNNLIIGKKFSSLIK